MMDVIIIDLYFGIKILTKWIMKTLIMLNIQIAMLFMLYQEQAVPAVHLEEILRMSLKLFKNMNQNFIKLLIIFLEILTNIQGSIVNL